MSRPMYLWSRYLRWRYLGWRYLPPALLAGLLGLGSWSIALHANDRADDRPIDGGGLYLEHCANCHGLFGEGDGIVSPALAVVLKDLRYLSARNNGEFPRPFIIDIIDGRAMRGAHGPEGMPVWGVELARDEPADPALEARVIRRIEALTDFLEAIQIHE